MRPLISCLMPTVPGREHMAKLAVQDFINQTWPNKELVVASSGDRSTMQGFFDWISEQQQPNISTHFIETEDGKPVTLGSMRNFLNDVAAGEWMCTWDDDDRNHPDRLQMHMNTANDEGADVTYLNMQLHCFPDVKQLWWVDWNLHRSPGYICYKKTDIRYPFEGDNCNLGEDTIFMRRLASAGKVMRPVRTNTPIYIRYYHGANAWNRRHHEVLVLGHSAHHQRILANKDHICAFLRNMQIQPPLTVMSREGVVFTYQR